MKRLVGGEYLLDLSSIELEQSVDGETYTNITNAEILEQLTNLKKFVPNPKMIKPAWVKLYNGETDELVVVHGQVSNVDDGEFDIDVAISGFKLKIHVEFTQAVNSDSVPIDDWYIASGDAKYLFTSDAQNLAEQLSDFTGDVKVTGDVDIVGKLNSDWEYERNLTIRSNFLNGITATNPYAKILVKNGVLYIVVSCILENTTEASITTASQDIFSVTDLPDEIAEKIYRKDGTNLKSSFTTSNNILCKRAYTSNISGGGITNFDISLNSSTANAINLYPRSTVTVAENDKKNFDFRVFITL